MTRELGSCRRDPTTAQLFTKNLHGCAPVRARIHALLIEDPMFAVRLRHADHVKQFSISATPDSGWEVRLEEDQRLRRLDHYRDWHRVERTLALFKREVRQLTQQGWTAW